MSEKLEFDLTVTNNELTSALEESEKKAFNLQSVLQTATGVFAGGLALKGIEAFRAGISSIISVGNQAVAASASQQVAVNNLNASLARAGNFTKEASDRLQEFASRLQSTSVFEDDAALSSAALLQSLTSLNADGLEQGVQAAADFATVLGVDLEEATRLVAKAAEGNVSALKRYGIEVKKGSTDSETFANALAQINSRFGGSASSQLNTYNGALSSLKNSYGDLLESIGDIIVKNPTMISLFNTLKGEINETTEGVNNSVPAYQAFVSDAIYGTVDALKVLFDAFDGITVVVKSLIGAFKIFAGAILAGIIGPIEILIDGIIFLGSKIPGLGSTFENLQNPIDGATASISRFMKGGIEEIKRAATDDNIFRKLSDGATVFSQKMKENELTVLTTQGVIKNSNTQRVADEIETDQAVLDARRQLQNDLLALELQLANEQAAFEDQQRTLEIEDKFARNEAEIQNIYDQKIREADAVLQGELLKNQAIKDAQQRALADEKAFQSAALANLKAGNEQELALNKSQVERQKQIDEDRKKNQKDTFAAIATLANSNNRELAAIGKAAAITQIAIDTPVAIGKALAAFPPPFNFAAAGLVGAAMAAQAARIAGVQFAGGGIVGQPGAGATTGPDNSLAAIREGEMILNASQQKKLFDMINGGTGGSQPIILQVDGRTIAQVVRDQLQGGFKLA